jgi:PAS domain S-box-containing protein
MITFHGMTLCPSVTADRLCNTDWTTSPLGPPDTWPPPLRQALQLCLNTRFPMLLIWGPDRITLYNDGFLPILGEKHPAGFGATSAEVFPEMVADFTAALDAAMAGRESRLFADYLLPVSHAGGPEEAYFTFCMSPVNDPDGSPCGVLSVATETSTDVLQRRRSASVECLAEELAKQSALEPISPAIRRVIATNPSDFGVTALFVVTPDGPRQSWCEPEAGGAELLEMPGVSGYLNTLETSGKHTTMPRLGERVFALTMVDEDLLGDEAFVLIVRPWKLVRICSAYEAFLRVVQESMVGAVCRVFAERRAMAAETRRADDRDRMYRLLFERSYDGVLICAPDGCVEAANPAACAMVGYTEEEIRALGREGLVDDGDGSLSSSLEQRRSGGAFVGELKFRRKDGTLLPVDVSSTVFRDEEEGFDRSVTLFRDAAPRLATQERVAATARLEAVGALTGGIAHDFNNLLNVIINGAEDLVERLPEPDPGRGTADMVLSASMRAADLTRQLLAFSRQQPMTPQTVDASRTLADLDQILSRTMGGGIDVSVDAESGAYAVADNSLLQSAILNLCINARDSMPEGGQLSIDAGLVPVDEVLAESLSVEPGSYVCIGVGDTGVGIPAEHLDRILEPFYTTKPVGHGTGLGLSMVFGFVRQSGGGLRVLSTVGEGTRVELYLPQADGEALPEEQAPAAAEPRPAGGVSGRLLVVEDESLLASMLERILQGAGYDVVLCPTGEQALEALAQDQGFDAVLTDILLGGGMDGWTLQRQVTVRRPALPVITMSGYTPTEPGRSAEELQAPTLHKPFRPREVLAVLDRVLAA